MSERDIDAEFDAIMARWDEEGTGAEPAASPVDPAAPASSNAPEPPRTVHDIAAAYAALSRPEPDAPLESDAPAPSEAWRAGPSIDAEDDHFEPPPVQLPPGEDLGYWGALVGLVGGPLVMLWVALSSPFHARWWMLGAIALFIGGFALLVMRQPKDRDPFDGDDGARV